MNVITTAIQGVLILEPKVFGDARGFFMESFNQMAFNDAVGHDVVFVQDNHSRSSKGVLRGLHYQLPPHAQGKLVRVTQGSVFDVAVDIRHGSATFGQWVGVELSGENHRQLWLPPGMAHGFLVTSESADFLYKTTDYYAPQAEGCVLWSDPAVAIVWPDIGMAPVLAAKDASAPALAQARTFELLSTAIRR
jgi:dTDP-4-dehydrorhamnose 3,5-epimerase